jgi:hypothetical protein
MKLSKKNALVLAPSMLATADLAIIEGGSAQAPGEAYQQEGPDGTTQTTTTGEGFQQYCETGPRGTLNSFAATPADGPAIHEVEDSRA